jgi:hypothetical protein
MYGPWFRAPNIYAMLQFNSVIQSVNLDVAAKFVFVFQKSFDMGNDMIEFRHLSSWKLHMQR